MVHFTSDRILMCRSRAVKCDRTTEVRVVIPPASVFQTTTVGSWAIQYLSARPTSKMLPELRRKLRRRSQRFEMQLTNLEKKQVRSGPKARTTEAMPPSDAKKTPVPHGHSMANWYHRQPLLYGKDVPELRREIRFSTSVLSSANPKSQSGSRAIC